MYSFCFLVKSETLKLYVFFFITRFLSTQPL